MSRTYDCREAEAKEEGLRTAATVLARGALVVLPTDTVYGVAADAFNPAAVTALLAAKGRGRAMPPPVLMSGIDVLAALTTELPADARALAEKFWPGGLTLICWAQPSLAWDLGDTGGTVAVRVPDHPIALALLRSCGPLATSSANVSGHPPAGTAAEAADQLGASIEVYLEMGELAASTPSTIVDCTTQPLTVVRSGAVTVHQLRAVVPDIDDITVADPDPDFSSGDLSEPDFSSGDLSEPDFSSGDLSEPDFSSGDLSEPDFSSGDLSEPDFSSGDLSEPDSPDETESDGASAAEVYDARAAYTARFQTSAAEAASTVYDARAAYAARYRETDEGAGPPGADEQGLAGQT